MIHTVSSQISTTSQSPTRVLVVDDNSDNCTFLALLLERKGYAVRTARSGAIALSIASEWRPDTVLLDIGLPDFDGCEVARRLRSGRAHDAPGIPRMRVIAVTGQAGDDEQVQKECDAGFDARLLKPYDFDAVEALVAARR